MEGELADEELCRLLVATNFTEGDGAGAEAMGLLDTTGRGGLRRILGGEEEYVAEVLTAAVLRAWDFAASCLRGALPKKSLSSKDFCKVLEDTYHQWTCERSAWYESLLMLW